MKYFLKCWTKNECFYVIIYKGVFFMKLELNITSHKLKQTDMTFQLADIKIISQSPSLVGLTGASGSGKTTILNILSGLMAVQEGSVSFDGAVIEGINLNIEYIAIDNNHFKDLSVIDNLRLVNSDETSIHEVTQALGIAHLRKKLANRLSKGEKERVSICRGLLSNKPILLFDEPTANLDPMHAKSVFECLSKLSENKIIIVASHESDLVKSYCDAYYELEQGRIIKSVLTNPEKKVSKETLNITYALPKQNRLITKWMLKRLVYQKWMLLFSIISFFVLLMTVFSFSLLNHVDPDSTLQNSFNHLKYDYYLATDKGFAKDTNPNTYLTEHNALKAVYLSSIRNVQVKALFQSEKTINLLGLNLNDYVVPTNYISTQTIKYSPILVSQTLLDLIAETGLYYQIGDMLPTRFSYEGTIEYRFVIVDVFTIDKEFNESGNNYFPCVIDETFYQDFIETTGILNKTYREGIKTVLESYNNYLTLNHPTVPIYKGIYTSVEFQVRLIKDTLITDIFYDEESVPVSGGYYLSGRLPEKASEIVVPSRLIYELLSSNPSSYAVIESFRQSFNPRVTLSEEAYFPASLFPSTVEVVGYYGYIGSNPPKIEDQILVHETLFDSLHEAIFKDGYLTYSLFGPIYYPKAFIQDAYDDLQMKNILVQIDEIERLDLALENTQTLSNFITVISVIFGLLSFTLLWLFIQNYIQSMQKERMLLLLIGVKKKTLLGLSILVLLGVYSSVWLVFMSFSSVFKQLVFNLVTKPVLFPGELITNEIYAYSLVTLTWLLTTILSTLTMVWRQQKQLLESIQHE